MNVCTVWQGIFEFIGIDISISTIDKAYADTIVIDVVTGDGSGSSIYIDTDGIAIDRQDIVMDISAGITAVDQDPCGAACHGGVTFYFCKHGSSVGIERIVIDANARNRGTGDGHPIDSREGVIRIRT